jgi:hypothetical protein
MPLHLFVPSTPGGNLDRVVGICWGTSDRVIYDEDEGAMFLVDDKECVVRAECEQYGEENNMLGVWGGKIRSSKDYLHPHDDDNEDTVTPVKIIAQDARLKKIPK